MNLLFDFHLIQLIYKTGKKYLDKAALTTAVITGGLGAAYSANGQEFDRTQLAGMDFYSRPNVVSTRAYGDGDVNSDGNVNYLDVQAINSGMKNDYSDVNGDGVKGDSKDVEILQKYVNGEIPNLPGDWNKLNRTEKIDWLDKRVKYRISQKIDLPEVDGVGPLCGNTTMKFLLNFGGIENFENFEGFDYNYDGKKEGYDYYKNYVENGVENIPIYFSGLTKKNGEAHAWPAVFVGSENAKEKDNPLDFTQWYVFDYGSLGGQVKPGDDGMDENKPVEIGWWGWGPNFFGEWMHAKGTLIQFYLNDGVASYKEMEISPYILFQNPHTALVRLKHKEDIYIERGNQAPILFEENIGIPVLETDLKVYYAGADLLKIDYTPKLNFSDSDKKFFNENYPKYFIITRKYIAESKIGRWNGRNCPNLIDSMYFKIIVDDTTPPVVNAPEDITIGRGASLGVERTGIPTQSDNSPYDLNNWFEDNEISDDGNFRRIERTFYSEDVRGNVGQDTQMITVDLNTGLEEFVASKTFDIYWNYPNPVVTTTTITYFSQGGNVTFSLSDLSGQTLQTIQKHVTFTGENEFQINMGKISPGTYFLTGKSDSGFIDQISIVKN